MPPGLQGLCLIHDENSSWSRLESKLVTWSPQHLFKPLLSASSPAALKHTQKETHAGLTLPRAAVCIRKHTFPQSLRTGVG